MTPLDHALAYAALGWRVIPIPPGHKHPHGIDDWPTKATTDADRIRRYWTMHPDHGVGIVCEGSGLFFIDVDSYAGGDEGWADLEAAYGPIPDTIEAITGRGGRHIGFRQPTDGGPPITNAAHAMPPGVDVRGHGGFVVAAPTIHPVTGNAYTWEIEHDPLEGQGVAQAPGWLLHLLRTPAPSQEARRDTVPYTGGDSIVDLFAANTTWAELLEGDGWTLHSRRGSIHGDYELWTRPGKDVRDGASASLYWRGSDVLKVFTPNAHPLQAMATYTRFGYWAATRFGGDHSAAAREYRRSINAEKPVSESESSAQVSAPLATTPQRRPAIIHNGRQLDEVVDEALDALAAHNDPPQLFQRSGALTRLRTDESGRPLLEDMNRDHMRHELTQAATWWRSLKDGGLTATSPPLEVATSALAAREWPDVPALTGIVELPVLRASGSFHADHGYDPSTRLFHWHRGRPYDPIPDTPDAEQLAAAVGFVDDMLCDFPWDTAADRANAWALLITPLVRAIVGQVPMALIDAPEPGTGKGLLVKVATIITTGRPAALMAWPATEEELEKKVTAALSAGSTVVVFDNVEGMIRSSTLAAVLTADVWSGRELGRTRMIQIANRATWAATGNNIDVGGDLARRCYRIRLDARQAQPWLRTGWRHADLEGWVGEHRHELLHALCTIVRSWWAAGRPEAAELPAMGGYASWVRTVGGILAHAGVGHFLANLAEFHASADREAQNWEAFLSVWHDELGEASMTVADLISRMTNQYIGSDLRDVIPDDLSGYWDTPGFSRRLGQALRRRVGRHYGTDGLHLVEMPRDRRKVLIYAVTKRPGTLAGFESPAPPAGSAGSQRDVIDELF